MLTPPSFLTFTHTLKNNYLSSLITSPWQVLRMHYNQNQQDLHVYQVDTIAWRQTLITWHKTECIITDCDKCYK